MAAAAGPLILVVEDDIGIRRLLRTGLELEGFRVVEAATLAQARSVQAERVDGVVLDRQLPDGDGLTIYDELRTRYAGATVVLHSSSDVPPEYPQVVKGDVDGLVDALGPATPQLPASAPAVAREQTDAIVEDWIELCRWDPELPVDSRPPIAGSVVAAVASALERPQPVGWGLDPALEPVAEAYALNNESVEVAVAQLVCLREVFERRVVEQLEPGEQLEAARRLTMIVQRLTTVVVRAAAEVLRAQAFTDPVTGLSNDAAFRIDLRREVARAGRHGTPLTVVRLELSGLDLALAGDDALRRVGAVLGDLPGREVHSYHLGMSRFAVLLPNTVLVDPGVVLDRLDVAGVRDVLFGVATSPPEQAEELDQLAERRMRGGASRQPSSRRR